jgi:segregation and condensation protein B
LFVATQPLSAEQLAATTGINPTIIKQALATLENELKTRGIRLSSLNGKYQLVSAPETSSHIRKFLQEEAKTELTRPALETLAIVAYRGPITKTAIEQIRGVASDTMIRNLLSRGLITEAGKSTEPGRPVQYAVSHTFLQHFGLTSPTDLPPIAPDNSKPQGDTHEN